MPYHAYELYYLTDHVTAPAHPPPHSHHQSQIAHHRGIVRLYTMLVAPHTIILCVHNQYNQSSKQTTKKTFKLYDKSSSIKVVVWVVYIIFEVLCLKPQRKYQCPNTMRGTQSVLIIGLRFSVVQKAKIIVCTKCFYQMSE